MLRDKLPENFDDPLDVHTSVTRRVEQTDVAQRLELRAWAVQFAEVKGDLDQFFTLLLGHRTHNSSTL